MKFSSLFYPKYLFLILVFIGGISFLFANSATASPQPLVCTWRESKSIWHPGYWTTRQVWRPGYWTTERVWNPGYWTTRQVWRPGYWTTERVWNPGRWVLRDVWVPPKRDCEIRRECRWMWEPPRYGPAALLPDSDIPQAMDDNNLRDDSVGMVPWPSDLRDFFNFSVYALGPPGRAPMLLFRICEDVMVCSETRGYWTREWVWNPGYWTTRQVWRPGYWTTERVWNPGYWTTRQVWRPGYWTTERVWNPGRWERISVTRSETCPADSCSPIYDCRRVESYCGPTGCLSRLVTDNACCRNNPPSAINLSVTQPNYCVSGPAGIFSWTFTDPDPGDAQSAYQVQVDNNSDFSSPEADSGRVNSNSNSYATLPGQLRYNTTYYWRLRVWDSRNVFSVWISGPSFTTPRHAYPTIDFTWLPQRPAVNEITQFTDRSTVFGGSTKVSWSWTFQDGNPATSSLPNPRTKFTSTGAKVVSLRVFDSTGYSCLGSKTVNLLFPLPEYREVLPR